MSLGQSNVYTQNINSDRIESAIDAAESNQIPFRTVLNIKRKFSKMACITVVSVKQSKYIT